MKYDILADSDKYKFVGILSYQLEGLKFNILCVIATKVDIGIKYGKVNCKFFHHQKWLYFKRRLGRFAPYRVCLHMKLIRKRN